MNTPILWIADYADQQQNPVNALVGRQPAGLSVLAILGDTDANMASVTKKFDELGDRVPCVWAGPAFFALEAGTVDFAKLPDHPTVTHLADTIRAYKKPALVRLLYECCNRKKDGSLRYDSPELFVALFEAIVARLPGNAIPVWSFGPGFVKAPVPVFADWHPPSAKVADVSMYRKDATYKTGAGAQVTAFVQVAKALKLPLIVGECGLGGYFGALPSDDDLKAHAVALMQWCAENNVRALAGPFNSKNYGMVQWVGQPLTAAYLKKKLGSGGFVSKALADVQPVNPLVAAGLVAA